MRPIPNRASPVHARNQLGASLRLYELMIQSLIRYPRARLSTPSDVIFSMAVMVQKQPEGTHHAIRSPLAHHVICTHRTHHAMGIPHTVDRSIEPFFTLKFRYRSVLVPRNPLLRL